MNEPLTDPADGAMAAELARLVEPMHGRIKREAAGALAYDYLCPGGPYPEQWDWDGFFMGVALATADARQAVYLRNWCLNFIHNADEDGFTPGVITPQGRDRRLHHMKPFLAQGAYLASAYLGDSSWLKTGFSQLRTIVDYRETHMWDRARGLGLWYDAMESGADNNVAFPDEDDGQDVKNRVAAADLNTFLHREYLAMSHLAAALGRADDSAAYGQRATALQEAVNTYLWSDRDNSYFNLDVVTGEHIRRVVYSNFLPLWGRLAPQPNGQAQIRRYLLDPDKLWAPYGVRTLAADDAAYNNANTIKPHSNWQGPVWPIANYLIMHALLNYGFQDEATQLARKITRLCLDDIRTSDGMHENYHADTGEPLAAPNFVSWNILVPQMLAEACTQTDPFALN